MLAIAAEVWGLQIDSESGERKFGQGRIIWGRATLDVLAQLKVKPDFEKPSADSKLSFIHRVVGDADVYFVSHQGDETISAECGFRISGRRPELWDPMAGQRSYAGIWRADGDVTRVTLPLGPKGSVFVVFQKPAASQTETIVAMNGPNTSFPDWAPILTADAAGKLQLLAWENGEHVFQTSKGETKRVRVAGLPASYEVKTPWSVAFAPGWGAPERVEFPQLLDWSQHTEPGIRYFSGTATYRATVMLPDNFIAKADRLVLDLGRVEVLAEVILNGKNLGVFWCSPFRMDLTDVARPGENQLEIRVTNLWPNRLIGDEEFPLDFKWPNSQQLEEWPDWLIEGKPRPSAQRLTFTTWRHWMKGDPLLPSGLIGPVTIRAGRMTDIKAAARE